MASENSAPKVEKSEDNQKHVEGFVCEQDVETDSKNSGTSSTKEAACEMAPPMENNDVAGENIKKPSETVSFKVIFNKQKFDVTFTLDKTVLELKKHLEILTEVPYAMQKLMYKGGLKDDCTLRNSQLCAACKVLMIGSTMKDVLSISAPNAKEMKSLDSESVVTKESLCKKKIHKTVLEKYPKPEDAPIGIKDIKEPLPTVPLSGMINKKGGKVRLTFKLETDQLWLGTKESTEKIALGSIKNVVSEPIDGLEEYHITGLQLGPTELSIYWIYYVPAQYVDAIKDAILGKWQAF